MEKNTGTGFWIRTAQREDIRQELSQELALGNVLPLLLALPLLVVAAIAAIQVSFRPLRRLEKPVRNMAPERIHPLDDRQAPKEVAGLVQAVNGLLKRLNQALERERRFSADADAGTDSMPEVHNLSELMEQSMADVAPLALKKHIEPVLDDTTGGKSLVRCHSTLINTLMRSLLANAIQYSPEHTTITTRCEPSGDGYLITVCDQGPGIPREERERALSRFVRLDQRQGGGAGLGLAIARRIAELHGGQLTLSGRPDGETGLCVDIWLPAATGKNLSYPR